LSEVLEWLLESEEPWTRYRTLVDLLGLPEDDPSVQAARSDLLAHPQVQTLITETAAWGEHALSRHNEAGNPLYAFCTLAEFGVQTSDDPRLAAGIQRLLAHQSPEGAFQTVLNVAQRYGGSGEDTWTWMNCDTPTVLYVLLAMGLEHDARVQRAVEHLSGLVDDNGWRCIGGQEVGKFRGPGRKTDPCPIANVLAMKALSLVPDRLDSPTTRAGAEMLLWHWQNQGERKFYLFGIGTDFRKLKYPFVWYDILHVVEVLSRFPFIYADARFDEMVRGITLQADDQGRYTATSIYRAWQGWSFADKKHPSPWLTFLERRIQKRIGQGGKG
jgi:hypothetical protein